MMVADLLRFKWLIKIEERNEKIKGYFIKEYIFYKKRKKHTKFKI